MAKPIKIEFLGDESDFLRSTKKVAGGLKDVEDAADDVNIQFGDTTEGVDRNVNNLKPKFATLATAIGGAFAVDKIIDFGTELFTLSSDLELTNRKIATVFGAKAPKMVEWADSVNESFGTSKTQVANMAAGVADLIKPMGATTDEAAAMSQEIVGLAPALAQWSAGQYDATEVSDILASALLGEREQLKGLGISIDQAEVNQRALELAQKDGRAEATKMDEALATQQLIFEKSTDAQAGYTAGTDTLAGQQANLQAKMTELKEFMATQLTPVFLAVGGLIVDKAVPALESMWGKFQELRPTLEDIGGKLKWVADMLQPVAEWMEKVVGWARENDTVMSGLKWAMIGVGVALGAVAVALAVGFAVTASVFGAVALAIGTVVGLFVKLVDTVKENKGKIYDAIVGPFRDGINWVKDQWDSLKKKVTEKISIPNPFGGITGILPGRAYGGTVGTSGLYRINERVGGETVFLPAGARVQPNYGGGSNSRSGDTFNIYAPNATPAEVAREIAWRRRIGDGR